MCGSAYCVYVLCPGREECLCPMAWLPVCFAGCCTSFSLCTTGVRIFRACHCTTCCHVWLSAHTLCASSVHRVFVGAIFHEPCGGWRMCVAWVLYNWTLWCGAGCIVCRPKPAVSFEVESCAWFGSCWLTVCFCHGEIVDEAGLCLHTWVTEWIGPVVQTSEGRRCLPQPWFQWQRY